MNALDRRARIDDLDTGDESSRSIKDAISPAKSVALFVDPNRHLVLRKLEE